MAGLALQSGLPSGIPWISPTGFPFSTRSLRGFTGIVENHPYRNHY